MNITLDIFLSFIANLNGAPLRTIGDGKSFTVFPSNDCVKFILESRTEKPLSPLIFQKCANIFNETGSYLTSHYQKVTGLSSYILGVFRAIQDDHDGSASRPLLLADIIPMMIGPNSGPSLRKQIIELLKLISNVCPTCLGARRGDGAWIFTPLKSANRNNRKNLITIWANSKSVRLRILPFPEEEYESGMRKLYRRRLHDVLSEFTETQQIAKPSNSALVIIDWGEDYVRDAIPMEWFENDSALQGVSHMMLGSRGKLDGEAVCDVIKTGLIADLDYRPYKKINSDEIIPGVIRLTFKNVERTELLKFEWQDDGSDQFFSGGTFKYDLPASPPYSPPTVPDAKKQQLVRPRPGQSLLRKTMGLAYNQKCCVTKCPVPETLEAAHIDDYIAIESNNPRNGLLLRSDIHALFDADLIAIEPTTFIVHFAPSARSSYAEWHGRIISSPKAESHKPDAGALSRRWKRFRAAHLSA